jgi:hypothetical protein
VAAEADWAWTMRNDAAQTASAAKRHLVVIP